MRVINSVHKKNNKKKNMKVCMRSLAIGTVAAASVVPFFMAGTSDVMASTGGKTASNAIMWVKSQVGKGIDYDNCAGIQCVDLVKAYYAYLGNAAVRGNGSDYVSNSLPAGWTRIKGAQPQKGDVLVYTGGYGGYGHVAIYESDNSHYHQNFNYLRYVQQVTYKYNGNWDIKYWGVIRPDFPSESKGEGSSSSGTSTTSSTGTAAKKPTADTAVKQMNGIWTFVKNGKIDRSYTGVARSTTGNWVFVKKGVWDPSFTGVAQSTTGNWVFVKKGRVDFTYTGVARSTSGNWVFVRNGRWDYKYTGVARSITGSWVFVKNGRWDYTYTGVARSTTGNWVFVKKGRFDMSFTGVAQSTTGNWVYVKNGRFDATFKGVAKVVNSSKKYYMVNGRWDRSFTGKFGGCNIKNGVVV